MKFVKQVVCGEGQSLRCKIGGEKIVTGEPYANHLIGPVCNEHLDKFDSIRAQVRGRVTEKIGGWENLSRIKGVTGRIRKGIIQKIEEGDIF